MTSKACPFMSGVVVIPSTIHGGYMTMTKTQNVVVACLEKDCKAWGTSIPPFVDPKYVRSEEGCGFCKLIEMRKCEF